MHAKLTTAVVAGLLACAGAATAQADIEANRENGKFKCSGKAARYDWMLVSTNGDPLYCKLSVNNSDKVSGDCFASGDKTKMTASGSMGVNNNCEVSGNLKISAQDFTLKADIQANMTKSQTTIIGALVDSSGSSKGEFGTFSAVRMEQ
jgi:opacity protein-like surface antigen